jgi:hypothetical protein
MKSQPHTSWACEMADAQLTAEKEISHDYGDCNLDRDSSNWRLRM